MSVPSEAQSVQPVKVRDQKDRLRTQESDSAPSRVWITKSEKDKTVQMAL
jgi:hypothetical protein